MKESFIKAVRLKALQAVVMPDTEAYLRSISRWFSRTYATPLYEVMDLPLDFVLQTYFEHIYSDMETKKLVTEVRDLLETEDERKSRVIAEEQEILGEMELLSLMAKTGAKLSKLNDVVSKNEGSDELAAAVKEAMAKAPKLEDILKEVPVKSVVVDPNAPSPDAKLKIEGEDLLGDFSFGEEDLGGFASEGTRPKKP